MKKYLIIVLLFAVKADAQKCSFDKNEYDKFTKQQQIEKDVKLCGAGSIGDSYLSIKLCKYDTLDFFRIWWIRQTSMVVGRTSPLVFLLDNQQTITAFPTEIFSSDFRTVSTQSELHATYLFQNSNDINELKSHKVVSVRINFNQYYKDTEIKEKFGKNLMQAAQCVY